MQWATKELPPSPINSMHRTTKRRERRDRTQHTGRTVTRGDWKKKSDNQWTVATLLYRRSPSCFLPQHRRPSLHKHNHGFLQKPLTGGSCLPQQVQQLRLAGHTEATTLCPPTATVSLQRHSANSLSPFSSIDSLHWPAPNEH